MKDLDARVDPNAISTGQGDGDNLTAVGRGLLDKQNVRFNSVQMEESRHADESRNTDAGREATQAMKDFIPKGSPLRLTHYSWGLFNREIADVERVVNGVPIDMQFVGMDQGLTDYNTEYGSHSDPTKHKDYSAHLSDLAPSFIGKPIDMMSDEEYQEVAEDLNNFTNVHNKFQEGTATQEELDQAMVRAYHDRSRVARFRERAFLNWGDGKKKDRWDRTQRGALELALDSPESIRGYNIAQANQRMVQTGWTPPIPEAGFWETQQVAFDKFHVFNALGEMNELRHARNHGKDLAIDEQDILAGVPQKYHAKLRQEMSQYNDQSAWVMRNQLMQDIENDRIYDNLAWYAQIGYAIPSFMLDPLTVVPGIGAGKVAMKVHSFARTWKASPMLKNTAIISSYTALGIPEGLISNAPQLMQDHTYTINDWYMDGLVDGAFATGLGIGGRFVVRPMWRKHKLDGILKRKRQLEVHEMQEHIQKEMESRGQAPKKVRTPEEQKLFNQKMKAYLKAKHAQKLVRVRKGFGQWIRNIENPNMQNQFRASQTYRAQDTQLTEDRTTLVADIKAAKERREELATKLGKARKTHNRRPNAHVDAAQRQHNEKVHLAGDIARMENEYQTLNQNIDNLTEELNNVRKEHQELKRKHKTKQTVDNAEKFTPLSAVSKVSSEGFRKAVDTISEVFPNIKGNHPLVRLMNSQKGLNARITLSARPQQIREQLAAMDPDAPDEANMKEYLEYELERAEEYNRQTAKRLEVVHQLNADILKIAAAFPDGKVTKGMQDAINAVANTQRDYNTVNAMNNIVRGDMTEQMVVDYAEMLGKLDIFEGEPWTPMTDVEFRENFEPYLVGEGSTIADPNSPDFDADVALGGQQYNAVTSQLNDIMQMNENVNAMGSPKAKKAMEKINGLMAQRVAQLDSAGRMIDEAPTPEPKWNKLSVAELKDLLREMKKYNTDIRITGRKAQLLGRVVREIERLKEAKIWADDAPMTASWVAKAEEFGISRQALNKMLRDETLPVEPDAVKYQDSTKRYEDSQPMSLSDAIARVESEKLPPRTDEYNDRLHELLRGGRIRTSEEIKRMGRQDPYETTHIPEADTRKEGQSDHEDADIEQDLFDTHTEQDKVRPIKDIVESVDQAPLPRSYTTIDEYSLYSRKYQGELPIEELEILRDRIRGSLLNKLNANELKIVKETDEQLDRLKRTKAALLRDKDQVVNRMIQSRSIDAVTMVLRAAEEIRLEAKARELVEERNKTDMPKAEQFRKNDIVDEVETEYEPRFKALEDEANEIRAKMDANRNHPDLLESDRIGQRVDEIETRLEDAKGNVKKLQNPRHESGTKKGQSRAITREENKFLAQEENTIYELEKELAELDPQYYLNPPEKPIDYKYAKPGKAHPIPQPKRRELKVDALRKDLRERNKQQGVELARVNDKISELTEIKDGDIEARFDNPDYKPREKYLEDLAALRADVQKHRDTATGDSNQTTKKKETKAEEPPKPKPPKNLVEEDLDDTVDGVDSGKDPDEKIDIDKQKNAAYDKLAAEAAEETTQFQIDFVAGGDQEIMKYAIKTMSNATDFVGRALSRWTKDLATKMMESDLTSVQALGFNITEIGRGFAGRIRRRRTGALIRDKVYKELGEKTFPAYAHALNAYAASKDKGEFGRMNAQQMSGEQMELVQKFNEEVFSIQELRRQGKPIPDTISDITQKYIDDVDAMFDHAHNRLVEAGIDGFTKTNKVKHYIPHVWQRGKLQGAISKHGMEFVEKLFTKAYLEAPAMGQKAYDQAGAEAAAKRQIKWIMEQDGSNSYEDQHLPTSDSRSKHRRDLNTMAEIDGVKIMDLLDTDLISVLDKYSHRTAGWVGLAESTNGLLSSDLKIHTYKESIIQEGKDKGVDTRKMEQWYDDLIDQMFGRPTRTFFANTWADKMMTKFFTGTDAKAVHKGLPNELRQLKDSTALAMMGGLGTAQLIETGQVLTRGMLNVFSDPEVIKLMFKMAGEDIDAPGVMTQIEEMSSISNNIEWWDRQSVHLDQQQLDEVGMVRKASLRIADAVTLGKYKAPASRLLGKTTGYNLIKKYQTRLVQASFALDVTRHFRDGTGKMSNARLADLGLTDVNGFDEGLQRAFRDHVEVDPKTGAIIDLHPDLWDKGAREKFQYAMLRDEAQQIQRTHVGELPTWMNRPLMALMFQFRQMPLVAQNKQLARSMAFADQEAVMALMLNAAIAGSVRYAKFAALGVGVKMITGDEWEEPYNGTDGSKWAGDSAKYMVQFGMMADAYDLVLGENQPEVKDWRDAGSRVLGTVPSLGVANEYRKLGQGVLTKDIETAVDGASGSTALSNTAYGEMFFNGVKEMVDGWSDDTED